jgi:tetratricopeptide (TPR) repeat protein
MMIRPIFLFILAVVVVSNAWAKDLTASTLRQVLRAHELQQQEQVTEAIELLAEVAPSGLYDQAYVNRMLGNLYWQNDKPNQAIRYLTLAVDARMLSQMEQRDTARMLADILLMQGKYEQAESRYADLLKMYSEAEDLQWGWLRVAQAQYQQEKWASVEKSILNQQRQRNAARLKPKVLPFNMLLSAQLAQKKWQSAIHTTRSLRRLEPDNVLWWKQLVALYMQTEKHTDALTTLQQADRANFTLSQEQLILMAQLYVQAGVPYKAAETYQRLPKLNQSTELLKQQANYWQLAKQWDNALESWRKAADLDPKYFEQYALIQLRLRDYQAALTAINKIPSQDASILITKAEILNQLGETTQALRAATQAHRLEASENTYGWVRFLTKVKETTSDEENQPL